MTDTPLLRAELLTRSFGGLRALDEVSLAIAPEQVLA